MEIVSGGRENVTLTDNMMQFLSSRVSTPNPFKPKHLRQFSEAELEALERLNLSGSDSPISPLRTVQTPSQMNIEAHQNSVVASKIDIGLLEKKAEQINGHT